MPELTDLMASASAIAAAGGGFEPQRVNNFMLLLNPPKGAAFTLGSIEMSLRSFPFPKSETTVETINYMNTQRKVPGRTTYPDMDLVVVDYVNEATASDLRKWRKLVFNAVSGRTGISGSIKSTGTVFMFAPDASLVRKWQLFGVWPSKDDFGAGDMEGTGVNLVTITFTVDYTMEDVLLTASSVATAL